MTNLLEHGGRLCRLGILALLAGLAACGPGTGGTGTGPVQGAVRYSGAAGANIAPAPGTSCRAGCDQFTLRLEEQHVELVAGCRRFVYSGSWAVGANGELVLNGTVETRTTAGTSSTAATLRLQFSELVPASRQVTVVLADEGGATLVGPAVLLRADALAGDAPPECGGP